MTDELPPTPPTPPNPSAPHPPLMPQVTHAPQGPSAPPPPSPAWPGSPGSPVVPAVPASYGEGAPVMLVPPQTARRRPVGLIVTVSLLSLLLATAIAAFVWYFLQLQDANATIREQQRELEEQRELIDKKETFGAAMEGLLDEVGRYEGVPLANLIPWDRYELLAAQSWARRWDATALEASIASVEEARAELVTQREAAEQQAASNASGSAYEATLDRLGFGYVTWVLEDADTFCEADVLACVDSENPLLVHVDAADDALEYTTDWLRTGIAYHEFAHVLQFTNPEPTDTALAAFDGDLETMADCFALTYLDGWTLHHTIWVNSYQYWEVDVGYGYTCTDAQRQVVRDWFDQLGVHTRQISA